jgi:hypothetical protein
MKTAIAISPTMRNVLSVAKIPPAAVKANQMATIAPRIIPMIRPTYSVCTHRPWQATVAPGSMWRALFLLAGRDFGSVRERTERKGECRPVWPGL